MVKVPKQVKLLNSLAGWVATLFPNVWGAVLTAGAATTVTLLALGTKFIEDPVVHSVVFIFVVFFWTFIGIVHLADRNRPKPVAVQKDLSYGIIIEGIAANYNPLDEAENVLNFSIQIRNFTPSALRYDIEKFEVFIANRITRAQKGRIFGLLQRGGAKQGNNNAFKKDDIKDFIGKEVQGSIEIEIAYGEPDKAFARIFKISLDIYLNFKNPPFCNFSHGIKSEADEPYTKF